jgi:hypothetical protein
MPDGTTATLKEVMDGNKAVDAIPVKTIQRRPN